MFTNQMVQQGNAMKKCRKATYLISKQQDIQSLNSKENLYLQTHLLVCRHCREYQKQLNLIQAALKKCFE